MHIFMKEDWGKYKWPFKKKRWNEKFERNALLQDCKIVLGYIKCPVEIQSDTKDYASVAQWIERCPPEACAAVRLRPDVYFLYRKEISKRD